MRAADLGDAARLRRVAGRGCRPMLGRLQPGAAHPRDRGAARSHAGAEDDAFREQDFGDWTGRRHSEIEQELGAEAYRAFWQSPGTNRPPGGESFADQIARARAGPCASAAGDVVRSCIPAPSARSSRSRSSSRRSLRCAVVDRSAVADADRSVEEGVARGGGESVRGPTPASIRSADESSRWPSRPCSPMR